MKGAALILFFLCIFSIIKAQSKLDTALLAGEFKEFSRKLDSAIANKDSALLDNLISRNFLRIHGTNGAVEERGSWINGLLKTVQNYRDAEESSFNKSLKYPVSTAAVEQAIVRRRIFKDQREIWLFRSNLYAKESNGWKLTQMQATLMHDGPIYLIKPNELNEFTGTYEVGSGTGKTFKISTLENQALYCPVPDGYWLLFFKTDNDSFQSQGGVYTILFERDGGKKITRFAYYRNTKSFAQGSMVEQATRK